jgi:hypothetical protein
VGIALDASLQASRWHRYVVEEVQASDVAQVVVVLTCHATTLSAGRTLRSTLPVEGWAWRLYQALDARRAAGTADPRATTDTSDLLGALPRIDLHAGDTSDEVLDEVRLADLDVIVDLSSGLVPASVGAKVREGVWGFRGVGDDIAEFEMLSGRSVIMEVSLVRRDDAKHARRVLATATFPRDAGSIARFRSQAYFGVTHLVVAELRRLHAGTVATPAEAEGPTQARQGSEAPASRDVIRWLAPLTFAKVVNRFSSAVNGYVQHWQIGIRARVDQREASLERPDMASFEWVASPAGHFYADPFLLERDGRTWLFVEDYSYDTRLGTIAVAEVEGAGRLSPFTEVIRSEGHLSYPYVFEADGEVFMIPESAAEKQVRLYRATSFPYRWEIVTVLHDGRAVDTSVVDHDGRWWFFTTLLGPRGRAAMLMLFSADTLTGSWVSHPMNPVSRDIRNIRGAGVIRPIEGRLVRPSQDCSHSYGYALSWMEVDALDERIYQERSIGRMEALPRLGMTATHTYNATSRWETVDGRFTRADRSIR